MLEECQTLELLMMFSSTTGPLEIGGQTISFSGDLRFKTFEIWTLIQTENLAVTTAFGQFILETGIFNTNMIMKLKL